MEYSDSSVYTSGSESDDTAQSVLREHRRRPGTVSFQQQRFIRLERRVRRHLSISVFDEQSLNLDTLFGDTARGVQAYNDDERARVRLARFRRRRFYAYEYLLAEANYGLDILTNDWSEERRIGVPQGDFHVRPFGFRVSPAQRVATNFSNPRAGGETDDSDWDQQTPAPIATPPYRSPRPDRYRQWLPTRARTGATSLPPPAQVVAGCLRGAKADIRRCLLWYILDIRRSNPNVEAETAWTQLVDRLVQERAITQASEAENLWRVAFGSPREESFQHLVGSSTQDLIALWSAL